MESGPKKSYTRADRTKDIVLYSPGLGKIEEEIKTGTFKGDLPQLKKRMHHLIGWFAADPKLKKREDYDMLWFHFCTLLEKHKPRRKSKMKPEEVEKKLHLIAAEYVAGEEGLYPDAPRLHAEEHYTLYKVWLSGGDVKETAISLYMAFDQIEAAQLARRLKSPQDFLDDLRNLMERQLVELGYVRKGSTATHTS